MERNRTARPHVHDGRRTFPVRTLVAIIALSLLATAFPGPQASAGDADARPATQPEVDPLVRCEPTSITKIVGEMAVIDLYIQNVTNLYGADVMVSYDPTIGQVQDAITVQPGTQILPLYTWMYPAFFTANGVYGPATNPPNCGVDCIWYAFTQFRPTDPVTGSGAIATVTFLGLQAGTFPMNWIYIKLSAPGGNEILPVLNQPCSVTFTNPLAVTLASFDASTQADHVLLTWETVSEVGNAGFNLYRSETPNGPRQMLNAALIPSQNPGSAQGAGYSWQDFGVQPDRTYYYWLEDVSLAGVATLHGPVSVDYVGPTAVTLSGVSASPAGPTALPLAGTMLALLASLAGALAVRRRA